MDFSKGISEILCPVLVSTIQKGYKKVERLQKSAMIMFLDLLNMPCSKRLKKPNLFTLSKRRLRGNLIMVYKCIHGKKVSDSRCLINLPEKDITRPNVWKLKLDKLRLEIKMQIFNSEGN